MLECVINISEGRDSEVLRALDVAAGESLRDRHSDPHHHRSVFTLIHHVDELRRDVHALALATLELVDLTRHHGVHPRLGVLDVVPFVALEPSQAPRAIEERDRVARWLGERGVPVFLYGPLASGQRELPTLRREAFRSLAPEWGPPSPNPRWGSSAVGARDVLLAWNIWLRDVSLSDTRSVARDLRRPGLRTLGLAVGEFTQVSCNIVDWTMASPLEVYDTVAQRVGLSRIERAELVGLAPRAVLHTLPEERWEQLGFSESTTIEGRLA